MKKLMFVLPNLNSGGAEKVTLNLIRSIKRDEFNIDIVVFNKTSDLAHLVPNNIKIINIKTKRTSKSLCKLYKHIKSKKPDWVYSTHSRVAVLLQLIKLFHKFNHVARMQSMPSLEKRNNKYGVLKRLLYSFAFKRADLVIAQTKEMKEEAVIYFNVKPEKIVIIRNPIDRKEIDFFVKKSSNPYQEKEISLVAAGRLSKEKGFDILIKALPEIIEEYVNLKTHIIGNDQGEKKVLVELSSKFDITNNIEFHGYVRDPYKYYYYADLFVLPSRYEGFPNAMLENYYLNTPIVATNCVPIVNELIEEGVNGYICKVDDVEGLKNAIIKGLSLRRENIHNTYESANTLEEYLS
jgi:glycosyltransferase involved in cell wall biosynthesis